MKIFANIQKDSVTQSCHSERSEESTWISPTESHGILRYALNDSQGFHRRRLLVAMLFVFALSVGQAETTPPAPKVEPRGGRVGWARLITPVDAWKRHAETDDVLSRFIRTQTSLNIDPTWYAADPGRLEQLCSYPLIFTNNLTDVTDPRHLANIAEYVRRGGFLFIDACINNRITPNADRFFERHVALIARLFPTAKISMLPPDHEIYRHYFVLKDTPPHSYMDSIFDPKWKKHGLYGVFEGDRMIGLLSLSGLQCGWAGTQVPGHGIECMKMTVNIYVYAMTR